MRDPDKYADEADWRAQAKPVLVHPSRLGAAHNQLRQDKKKQKPIRHDGEVAYRPTRKDRKRRHE